MAAPFSSLLKFWKDYYSPKASSIFIEVTDWRKKTVDVCVCNLLTTSMVTLYLLSRSGNRLENLYLINHLWWQKPCCWCWSEALPRRGILSHLSRTHDHKLHEKQDFLVATAIQADEIQEALETAAGVVLRVYGKTCRQTRGRARRSKCGFNSSSPGFQSLSD